VWVGTDLVCCIAVHQPQRNAICLTDDRNNPMARKHLYRPMLIRKLPQLIAIDGALLFVEPYPPLLLLYLVGVLDVFCAKTPLYLRLACLACRKLNASPPRLPAHSTLSPCIAGKDISMDERERTQDMFICEILISRFCSDCCTCLSTGVLLMMPGSLFVCAIKDCCPPVVSVLSCLVNHTS
jgi:hypothetical protein